MTRAAPKSCNQPEFVPLNLLNARPNQSRLKQEED
jgi:hypothetical protein